jgi:hypothetical protein
MSLDFGVETIFLLKTISAGGGLRPPPALMGFEKEDGRVDPQHRRNPGPILKITVFGPLGNSLSLCVHPACTSRAGPAL